MFLAIPVFVVILFTADFNSSFSLSRAFWILLVSPIAEEMLFRGVIQEYLIQKIGINKFISKPNIITTVIFTLMHLIFRLDFMALLVFFPSIVLGVHYDRHRSVVAVILLHMFYNSVVVFI